MKSKNIALPIFLTVFLDMLGVGIVIPIIPSLFLDFNNGFLPTDLGISSRNILLGFLLASYSFAQFFGSPVLGALSDNRGRKPILTISLIGTLAGYLLFAFGLQQQSIVILFLSRLLDGFTGGNISIAFSVISDISDEKSKAKNFGMVGAAFGLGFILGPYIGGKLADPTLVSWFNVKTPFYFAAFLAFLNILSVRFYLPETLSVKNNRAISFGTGIKNVAEAFTLPHLRKIFLMVFFITLGFTFFTTFFQVFCFNKYHWKIPEIADFFAYIGLWIVIAQGGLIRPLSKKYSPIPILKITLLTLSIALFFVIVPDKGMYAFIIGPFIALSQGISSPNVTTIVSEAALPQEQGKIMGINQSVASLAMTIPPIIAGFVTNISASLPNILASVFTLLAWFVLLTIKSEKKVA